MGTVLAAPYLVSHEGVHRHAALAGGLAYVLGSGICHQRPERSYHPWDTQSPVCARCEGIYLAAPFGIALVLTRHRRRASRGSDATARAVGPTRWVLAWRQAVIWACLPTAVTLAWEWTTGDMTPGVVRLAAGAALGGTLAALVAAVAVGEVH
jgi:hypothetical protein